MTTSAFASGTQTCVVGTEHFVSSPNAAGLYQLALDLNALADGDVLEVRTYQMVLTGGTQRVRDTQTFYGAQPTDGLILNSIPVGNELTDTNAIRFSIKQTFGTGRAIPWKVLKYA